VKRGGQGGFTMLELMIALAIVAALLLIAFGGLRIAVAAWQQGEDRAEAHQEIRSLVFALARSLSGAYPYRAARGEAPDPELLFASTETGVEFVTQLPPVPVGAVVAFTAVVISVETGENPGLVIRQRVLPNRDPFTEATVVLRDPGVTRLTLRYLDDSGAWRSSWNGEDEATIPRAVEIVAVTSLRGRDVSLPPLTVALRAADAQ
jgi:general secretion pathway protein J